MPGSSLPCCRGASGWPGRQLRSIHMPAQRQLMCIPFQAFRPKRLEKCISLITEAATDSLSCQAPACSVLLLRGEVSFLPFLSTRAATQWRQYHRIPGAARRNHPCWLRFFIILESIIHQRMRSHDCYQYCFRHLIQRSKIFIFMSLFVSTTLMARLICLISTLFETVTCSLS